MSFIFLKGPRIRELKGGALIIGSLKIGVSLFIYVFDTMKLGGMRLLRGSISISVVP